MATREEVKEQLEGELKQVETESQRLRRELAEVEAKEREERRKQEQREKAEAEAKRVAPLKARAAVVMGAIVAKLEAAGLRVARGTADRWNDLVPPIAEAGGVRLPVAISELVSGSTWHRRPTGAIRLTVGDYGNKKIFPEGKAGLSVDKIAAEIASRVGARRAADKARKERETGREIAMKAVEAALVARGLPTESWKAPMAADEYGRATVNLRISVEPGKAGELLDKLLAAGFIAKPESK